MFTLLSSSCWPLLTLSSLSILKDAVIQTTTQTHLVQIWRTFSPLTSKSAFVCFLIWKNNICLLMFYFLQISIFKNKIKIETRLLHIIIIKKKINLKTLYSFVIKKCNFSKCFFLMLIILIYLTTTESLRISTYSSIEVWKQNHWPITFNMHVD